MRGIREAVGLAACLLLMTAQTANAQDHSDAPPPTPSDTTGCGVSDHFVTTHAYCEAYIAKATASYKQTQTVPVCPGNQRQDAGTHKCIASPMLLANKVSESYCQVHHGIECIEKKKELSDTIMHCSDVRSVTIGAVALRKNLPTSETIKTMYRNQSGSGAAVLSLAEVEQIVGFAYSDKSDAPTLIASKTYSRCLIRNGIPYNPF